MAGEDRTSTSYVERLTSQTVALDKQGDGMRSFVGIILHTLVSLTHTIVLIDEPEAFLHPPQARLLGKIIALNRLPGTQIFISTHSQEFLQGLLEANAEDLRVVRLQRQANGSRALELDQAIAISLSRDPLMKYSNALSGVFHQRVVACESDSDCLFYSSILGLDSVRGANPLDVLFVHTGGKHRLSQVAAALTSLGVQLDVIVDIDILSDLAVFRRLVVSMKGDWTSVSELAERLKKNIESQKKPPKSSDIVQSVRSALKKAPKVGLFPKEVKSDIEAVLETVSPWKVIKRAGESAIPSGNEFKDWSDLKQNCSNMGIWIVPVGEVEGFKKSVGNHGPKWAQEVVVDVNFATDPELQSARTFVKSIWDRMS